ncbi:methanethiol S-methyltransferase [Actinocorallia longicatena]|uniref:methanethiol S-methyltransferase n=1 Tax=Actinocorallia longicatena TaxID=111803 RepID=A0ABP6QI34_9ACTN
MSRRALAFGYAGAAYLAFLAVILYTIGFLAGAVVPKGVDDGPGGPAWAAVLVDLVLLGLFAVQHSVMARPWFKRWWTRRVPAHLERSTYVLAASLLIALLLWQWRPLTSEVWSVGPGWARGLLWTVYLFGWAFLVLSTYLIDHFELFGLRQAAAGGTPAEPAFRRPLLYRLIRHPIMTGFLIAFWAAPDMSAGRLLFALASTGYILIGVRFEEHDLRGQLGESYERYSAEVPRFVPLPGRAAKAEGAADARQVG